MATLADLFTNMANAIRTKGGTSAAMYPSEMPQAIAAIPAGQTILTEATVRPDAEKIASYAYDKRLVEDEEIAIPAYTTTATTLKAAETLTSALSISYTAYDYRFLTKMLATPIYAEGTAIATGHVEYWAGILMHDLVEVPSGNFIAASGKAYTSRTSAFYQSGAFYRVFYWSSSSAVTTYGTSTYSTYMTASAPTVSSSKITLKSPALMIRGHSTYLRSSVWSTIADIRYQYIVEAYRVPKGNLNLDGWGSRQAFLHVLDDVNNNDGTLT